MLDMPEDMPEDAKARHDMDTLLEAKKIREDEDRMARVKRFIKEQRQAVPRSKNAQR